MKNLFKIRLKKRMEYVLTASFIIMIIAYILFGCQVSNKAHWLKNNPHGGWAGRSWMHGVDSIKPVLKK